MKTRTAASTPRSAGITLTEILISILILGVGLVSLATLFPIGLLRLREAQRQTRSAYLFQSATADVESRGLFNSNSFIYADLLNPPNGFNLWYYSQVENVEYNPLIQDTPAYGADPFAVNPNAPEVEGDRCYPDLRSVPGGVEWVVIGTRPETADATMRECVELGIGRVWMHRAFGEGSVSPSAVAFGRDHGVTVIDGACPCMFDPTADVAHKCMRVMLGLAGKVPRQVATGPG